MKWYVARKHKIIQQINPTMANHSYKYQAYTENSSVRGRMIILKGAK